MPLIRRVLCALLLACSACAQFTSGPYVPAVTTTTATVMWVGQAASVRFGTDPAALNSEVPVLKANHVTLTGLKPATTYHYDVPGAGKGDFTTPPAAAGVGDFTFVVYGDNRTRHDVYRKIAGAIAGAKPTFVVHAGDQIANGRDTSLWPIFFDISREFLRHAAFFPALGNHESNTPLWYEFYDKSRAYYSFDWGRIHWVMLNSDVGNVSPLESVRESYWTEQLAWAEKDLAAHQDADFRFLVFHHPPYSAVLARHPAAAKIAERVIPLIERGKVQAVFCGHDHNYQRHTKAGVQYVVTGGGGAPLYAVDGPLPGLTQKVEMIENYVFAKANGQTIVLEARTIDGRVIDSFELTAKR
jgi:hypothetical protein